MSDREYVRGKERLRVGYVLAIVGDIVNKLGEAADSEPSRRHQLSILLLQTDRMRSEILRLFGEPCEHCHGYGTITWGGSEPECNACEGTGKGNATITLAERIADGIEAGANPSLADDLGRQFARERNM